MLGAPPGFPLFSGGPMTMFALIDGNPEHNQTLMDSGFLPWWTRKEVKATFCRYLTILTHLLDYRLWPDSPFLMHLHSLAWFAGCVGLAAIFYRRLLLPAGKFVGKTESNHVAQPPSAVGIAHSITGGGAGATSAAIWPAWVAGLAAVFFALDYSHGIPAGWLANRNQLTAMLFCLLALIAHDRWRRENWKPGVALAPLALATALFSGEAAVAAMGYLFAHTLFLDPAPLKNRWKALAPHGLVFFGWWVIYKKLGLGAYGSGIYIDPATEPTRFAKALILRAPVLFLGQVALPPSDVYMMFADPAAKIFSALAWLFVLMAGYFFWPLLKRDATARFFALGTALALVPPSATFPSNRLLTFAGLGALGLAALFIGSLTERRDWLATGFFRRILSWMFGLKLLFVHAVVSPLLLPLMSMTPIMMGKLIDTSVGDFPNDPSLVSKDAIIVNAPNPMMAGLIMVAKALKHEPSPAHYRVLAPADDVMDVKRTDERTLAIRPRKGFFPTPGVPVEGVPEHLPPIHPIYAQEMMLRLSRDEDHPLKLHERIELTGLNIEVTEMTRDGRPAEVAFRFDKPLEDPSLIWFQWGGKNCIPFTPPKMGETTRLNVIGIKM